MQRKRDDTFRVAGGPVSGSIDVANPQRCVKAARGAAAWRDGWRAEDSAAAALVADGWSILRRRARTASGEIDLVAEKGAPGPEAMLAFVEVKARPVLSAAAHALTVRQRERLLAAAELLLAENPDWRHGMIRFDLILVDASGSVRRIADAFRQE